jgi:ATP-dependent RNA helicase RhlE
MEIPAKRTELIKYLRRLMSSFSDLNLTKPLRRALGDLGLETPTPIQEHAFPVIMSGRDAIGIAQTGTGKTLAYLLPILRMLDYSEQRHPRVLILVPTRELVVQVVDEIVKLTSYMSVRVAGVYGASNINKQKQQVYDGQDIIVSTPGRLIDLTHSRSIQFNAVKRLVIDEVDEMLNLGFRPQLVQLLDLLPPKRQNLLFSATLSEEVESMINNHFSRPEYIELHRRGTPLEKIKQEVYNVPNFYTKINLLEWMLEHDKHMQKVLVFVRNKGIADDLEKELGSFSHELGVIHSNRSQPHRFDMVRRFGDGSLRVLIATDVIARGLDLPDVSHVINFDIPLQAETYIHRIGRTGRADREGITVGFVTPKEQQLVTAIETLMNKKLEVMELPEIEIADKLTKEERPAAKDKTKNKVKHVKESGGAFHEKKAKNKKLQLGGKRRQEKQKRALEKSRSKRGR